MHAELDFSRISNKKILVIEDSVFWQTLFHRTLKNLDRDFEVRIFKNVEEFESAGMGPLDYDLIIADHYLGGKKTGLDLWRSLQRRNVKPPFLLASAIEDWRLLDLTDEDLTPPHFIEKSLVGGDFHERIKNLLNLRTARRDGLNLKVDEP